MEIAYGGQKTLKEIKTAIRSTHGVVIHSQYALYSRSDGQPLPLHERGHHLYSDYAFSNEPRSDGTVADTNAVWFADWYLDNLNALYSAPIDYDLMEVPGSPQPYRQPPLRDPPAEPVLRGPRVPHQLPQSGQAVAGPHASAICRTPASNLGPPFRSWNRPTSSAAARWEENSEGTIQLHFRRARCFAPAASPTARALPPLSRRRSARCKCGNCATARPVENQLVRQFYQLWSGDTFTKPSPKELILARELIERHGRTKLHALLPLVVKRLKDQWPDAKTFSAAARYLPEVNAEYERKQAVVQREKQRHSSGADGAREAGTTRSEQRRWSPSGGRPGKHSLKRTASASRLRSADAGPTSPGCRRCSSGTAFWNSSAPAARRFAA